MKKKISITIFLLPFVSLAGCARHEQELVKNMTDFQLAMCEMQSYNSLGYCKQEMNNRVSSGKITNEERNNLDVQACSAQPLKCQSSL